jgi:hypothetical protein
MTSGAGRLPPFDCLDEDFFFVALGSDLYPGLGGGAAAGVEVERRAEGINAGRRKDVVRELQRSARCMSLMGEQAKKARGSGVDDDDEQNKVVDCGNFRTKTGPPHDSSWIRLTQDLPIKRNQNVYNHISQKITIDEVNTSTIYTYPTMAVGEITAEDKLREQHVEDASSDEEDFAAPGGEGAAGAAKKKKKKKKAKGKKKVSRSGMWWE